MQGANRQVPVQGNDEDLSVATRRDVHQLGVAAPLRGYLETEPVEDSRHVAG